MEFEFDVFDLDPEYLLSYQECDDTDTFGGVASREDWWETNTSHSSAFDAHFMSNEQIRGEE